MNEDSKLHGYYLEVGKTIITNEYLEIMTINKENNEDKGDETGTKPSS